MQLLILLLTLKGSLLDFQEIHKELSIDIYKNLRANPSLSNFLRGCTNIL